MALAWCSRSEAVKDLRGEMASALLLLPRVVTGRVGRDGRHSRRSWRHGADFMSEQTKNGREAERIALIDGSNVAHEGEGGARLENIRLLCEKMEGEGYQPVVVVDASLRHQIDDEKGYEALVQSGRIRQAPAGTDADYFILSFARELGASVVSNDRFKERQKEFPEVRDQVIRYMILEEEVVLERRTKRRS
jgi:hypothetical protein